MVPATAPVKSRLNVPLPRLPDPGARSSNVTLCWVPPEFHVQVTTPFASGLTDAGLKKLFPTLTCPGLELVESPHAAMHRAAAARNGWNRRMGPPSDAVRVPACP